MNRSYRPLAGHSVVISGAGSGIGRSLALLLAAQGCPVAISDINAEALEATESSLSDPVLSRCLDVADAQAQRSFAEDVRAWTPTTIGAVFNNAGVAIGSRVLDSVIEDDDWLWDINFRGVVNGTRAFLPLLIAQNYGAIVNTSSVFGLLGMPTQSAYCASKFAVRGFTDALRQELRGSGVAAITVHPGGINTNIVRNARFRKDLLGLGHSHEQMISQFAATAMTQPVRAAEIIQRGVEHRKARILVGPDAYLFDILARLAPSSYYALLAPIERRLRSRRAPSPTSTTSTTSH